MKISLISACDTYANFTILHPTKKSVAFRRLVFGVGINDADYMVSPIIHGKQTRCIFYTTWKHMLERCYCQKYLLKKPSYNGCKVVDEWKIFSNFKLWMELQDWHGNVLDKDILVPGNRIYSPERCLFVATNVNALLTGVDRSGEYIGVWYEKGRNRFKVSCHINGVQRQIGRFQTKNEASIAYKDAKAKEILRVADLQENELLRRALYVHAEILGSL